MPTINFTVEQSLDGKTVKVKDTSDYLPTAGSRYIVFTTSEGVGIPGYANPILFPVVALGDEMSFNIDKDYAIDVYMASDFASVTYNKYVDIALNNFSKAKLYDRESKLLNKLVSCVDSFSDVNYNIIRWIDNSQDRLYRSDKLGSQRFLDKIANINVNDCNC